MEEYITFAGQQVRDFREDMYGIIGFCIQEEEFDFAPEEALADNFSYAIMYGETGMNYKSPEIIRGICEYLRN